MLKHSLVALAALGAGILAMPSNQASAFPAAPAVQPDGQSMIVDVRNNNNGGNRNGHWNNNNNNNNHHWDRNRHGNRCNNWSNNCRYRYGGYYYQNPWWLLPMVGAGVAIGAGAYGNDYYDRGSYGSRHVEWCMNRYRSYNPRNNTWVSYSGRVYQCASPYGR